MAYDTLLAIWIIKAKENQNFYGNTIELNFLLKGLNLLLKNVVNNVCLLPFRVRTCECICLWPAFQKCQSLAYYGTWIWVLFGWWAELYSEEKYSDTKQSVGSQIWSCWLVWHEYKRGPTLCPTISWRLERGHNSQPSKNMQFVNDMCTRKDYVRSCKRSDRIWWSPRQGSVWFSLEHITIGSVYMWLEWKRSSIKSKQLGLMCVQLCWNLKSIMALWVSGCKPQVPFTKVVKSITRGAVVVFSVKLVHKHDDWDKGEKDLPR